MQILLLLITLGLIILLLSIDFDKLRNKKDPRVKPEQVAETKKINEITTGNVKENQGNKNA